MPTQKKVDQVANIRQTFERSGGVYFADLARLSAVEVTALRRKLRKENIRLLVAKNRLTRRALVESGVTADLKPVLRGPTSMMLGAAEEPYIPGRRLKELLDKNKECRFKGAFVESAFYAAADFDRLATMPTRPELQSMLVGVLMSPITQLVGCLDGIINGLVACLEEIKDQRAAAPAVEGNS